MKKDRVKACTFEESPVTTIFHNHSPEPQNPKKQTQSPGRANQEKAACADRNRARGDVGARRSAWAGAPAN